MDEFNIAPDWLEITGNSIFFYPSAGNDFHEALAIFRDHVAEFWFCDIAYPSGLDLQPVFVSDTDFRLVWSERSGAPTARMEQRIAENGLSYRFLQPSKVSEIYERTDGRRLIVVRRRGFAQIALSQEFAAGSIGVFMHRGDSPGESGSNVYFLANKKSNYEPCGSRQARHSRERSGTDYFGRFKYVDRFPPAIPFEYNNLPRRILLLSGTSI